MNWLTRLPGFTRSPPGLERRLLRQLPFALAAGTLVPYLWYLYARLLPNPAAGESVDKYLTGIAIDAIAIVITAWTAAFTLAIGCVIVILMKGPAYVADRYPLSDADQPHRDTPDRG